MTRKIILFGSLVFVGLTAGAAYVVWFDYNPHGMSGPLYIAKMQHAIRVLTIPLPAIVLLGLLFTVVASFQARRDRPVFYLLVAASVCVLVVGLITRFGNIPINDQILTWRFDTPPENWAAVAQKWWHLQTTRLILQIAAFGLVSSAVLVRTNEIAT